MTTSSPLPSSPAQPRAMRLPRILACVSLLVVAACGDVALSPDGGPETDPDRADGSVDQVDAGSKTDAMGDPIEPAMLEVDRSSNHFGNVLRDGRSATARFVLRNTGEETSGELSTKVGGDDSQFELDDGCAGEPLAGGASCELLVVFAPSSLGAASATVTLQSEPGGSISIDLSGAGLAPGALRIDDSEHDFGAVAISELSDSKGFVIENTGDVDTGIIKASLSSDAFEITSDACSGSALAARASCAIGLRFGPDSVGSATGSLTLSATPGGNVVAALGGAGDAEISVTPIGSGSGRVGSNPDGINCGTSCSANFETSAVNLDASADPGSVFMGWGGDCTGAGDCELELDGAATVQARFEALRSLQVSTDGSGAGTVSSAPTGIACGSNSSDCEQDYVHGTTVILTAVAAQGSTFAGWQGCDNDLGEDNGTDCTVQMNDARKAQVSFKLLERTLTVEVDGGTGKGSVSSDIGGIDCGDDCEQSYGYDTEVTLTASAALPYSYHDGWKGCDQAPADGSCRVRMSEAKNVRATFTLHRYNLSIANVSSSRSASGTVSSDPNGIHCSVPSCTATYDAGQYVGLTATPGPYTTFVGWEGCIFPKIDANGVGQCAVLVDQAKTVTAKWSIGLD